MYNRRFFQTKLGQAALASMAAMATFAALSTQIQFASPQADFAQHSETAIEIA